MADRQRELVDILNKWAYEYYVLDAPTVSDKEYDALYDELRAIETQTGVVFPDSPTRRVGGEPIKGFEKHTHIARLFSLDKSVSTEQLQAFLTRVEKFAGKQPDYTVEYKFDGLTVCLTYDKGQFVRATTRGNGVIGEDVTAQVLTIKSFPLKINYQGTLEVRGEAIIRLSVLEKYNQTAAEPLKTPVMLWLVRFVISTRKSPNPVTLKFISMMSITPRTGHPCLKRTRTSFL